MLLVAQLPDSRSYFRLVWKTTVAGNDSPNPFPLPLVLHKRVVYVVCDQFSGVYTLYRGIYIPEKGNIVWDTEFSANLSDGATLIYEISTPTHYYYPSLNPAQNYTGPILVWTQIEGV